MSKKIYFLSDFHLGAPHNDTSLEREKLLVKFFDEIKKDAAEIFIVGDMFDFWYEYKKVVPKGHVRILGKLAELTDSGIPVHFFVGNHDMWMRDYFQEELNIPVYFNPEEFERNGKKFLVGHGDGLGPGDHGYKRLKKIFRNPVCKWLFGILPPRWGMGLANWMSRRSRAQGLKEEVFLGEDKEWLIIYCKEVLKQKKIDFFVFGHRHLAVDYRLSSSVALAKDDINAVALAKDDISTEALAKAGESAEALAKGDQSESRYINLGDWLLYYSYAVFDGNDMQLYSYKGMDHRIIRK